MSPHPLAPAPYDLPPSLARDSEIGSLTRRTFLGRSVSCAAHLCLASAAWPPALRHLFAARPAGDVVRAEPWGRIERLAEDAWALISTPLSGEDDAFRTVSNGGILAGRDGILVVEGFASPEGAAWLSEAAHELTGRRPTHVVLTHHHGDHSAGLGGYADAGSVRLFTTSATRDRVAGAAERSERMAAALEALSGDGVELLEPGGSSTIDLGDRQAVVTSRAGHTASDLTVTVEDPSLVWCGDLVWNGMFPNYVDAIPSRLSRSVRQIARHAGPFVPGHGEMADAEALSHYLSLIDDVEAAARRAIDSGTPLEAAAGQYAPPGALGEWVRFSENYYERAFRAWERELGDD